MIMNRTIQFLAAASVCCALLHFPATAQEKTRLSDAEVAFVAVTANQIDIQYAAIAKEKSRNAEVIKFAETMERDHKAVIAQAVALVKKLGVTPKDNAVSKQLMADAEKTKMNLRSTSLKLFDKKYVDNEVAYHKAVIAAVKGLLLPETENAELKALLTGVVPALEAHLHHAEMLQKQIR